MTKVFNTALVLLPQLAAAAVVVPLTTRVMKFWGITFIGTLLISLPAHTQVLMLHCQDKSEDRSNKCALIINLTSSTFTLYRNGVLNEEAGMELVSVGREKIVLYSSYGGSPKFIDRINGTFSVIGRSYPCIRVEDIPTTPKF